MTSQPLLIFLIVGVIAGWLASRIVRGYGLGLLASMIVGVIGSFIGGWLFVRFGVAHGGDLLGQLVGATIGAVILLYLVRFVRGGCLGGRFFRRRI